MIFPNIARCKDYHSYWSSQRKPCITCDCIPRQITNVLSSPVLFKHGHWKSSVEKKNAIKEIKPITSTKTRITFQWNPSFIVLKTCCKNPEVPIRSKSMVTLGCLVNWSQVFWAIWSPNWSINTLVTDIVSFFSLLLL